MANRSSRRAAKVFKLTPFEFDEPTESYRPDSDIPYYIEGDILGFVVVKVPTYTTTNAASALRQYLQNALHKKVLVLTSNVHFVTMKKCTASEAATIVKQAQEVDDGEA